MILHYPINPTLRECMKLADAQELLERAESIIHDLGDEKQTELLQEVFGDEIVGDPYALEDYKDAKETIAKAVELRQECTEAQEALKAASQRISALERKLRDIERVLLKGKGSKLDAISKILAAKH